MEQIAFLNNCAINSLRSGDLPTAASLLRQALEGTRGHSELVSATSAARSRAKALVSPSRLQFSQKVGVPDSISKDKSITANQNIDETVGCSLYLHKQGVSFSPETLIAITPDPLVRLSITSSFILYNLGVVNQLQGLQYTEDSQKTQEHQESREHHTQRAYSLYATSRRLLEEVGLNPLQVIGLPLVDFLSMAISNNAGYAAFVQGDYALAKTHFQQLETFTSSLRAVTPFQQWDNETFVLMDQYMNEFLLNTLVLCKPVLAAAA